MLNLKLLTIIYSVLQVKITSLSQYKNSKLQIQLFFSVTYDVNTKIYPMKALLSKHIYRMRGRNTRAVHF